jgi:hypothetical protein
VNEPVPGLFNHHKGGHYRLLFCASARSGYTFSRYLFPAMLSEARAEKAVVSMERSSGELVVRCKELPGYEHNARVAVYASQETGSIWVRPLAMFVEPVLWPDQKMRARFIPRQAAILAEFFSGESV